MIVVVVVVVVLGVVLVDESCRLAVLFVMVVVVGRWGGWRCS